MRLQNAILVLLVNQYAANKVYLSSKYAQVKFYLPVTQANCKRLIWGNTNNYNELSLANSEQCRLCIESKDSRKSIILLEAHMVSSMW